MVKITQNTTFLWYFYSIGSNPIKITFQHKPRLNQIKGYTRNYTQVIKL